MARLGLPIVAHVFLLRDGAILLQRRHGTGFADGEYGLVGGHIEGGESIRATAVRECREEVGITVDPVDLQPLGVVHYTAPTGEGVDFFFAARRWTGEPTLVADADDLRWCRPDALPPNTIPFVRRAIHHHLLDGHWFDEDGWSDRAASQS
jgi:8-oxo-dGTP pyrophosphatase MutT (NUDIX family)